MSLGNRPGSFALERHARGAIDEGIYVIVHTTLAAPELFTGDNLDIAEVVVFRRRAGGGVFETAYCSVYEFAEAEPDIGDELCCNFDGVFEDQGGRTPCDQPRREMHMYAVALMVHDIRAHFADPFMH
jgi:hypothetical protein